MAKARTVFVCGSCGHEEHKWLGRCPSCGEWNALREFRSGSARKGEAGNTGTAAKPGRSTPRPLAEVDFSPPERYPTEMAELDRVLGGGLAPGATVLLGGEPGIGKSTLMLQTAATLKGRGLYVSGEESPAQIKSRAVRLNLNVDNVDVLAETDLDTVMGVLEAGAYGFLIVDSIQTLLSADAGAVPGTTGQLRIAAYRLTSWAKSADAPLFLIAHVTKEGLIAGPKVIEHLVDTVLYFDQSGGDVRILRASKNRMGSVDEVGLFLMDPRGLLPVADPAELFLGERVDGPPPGSAVAAVYEGTRILLAEIQALVVPAKGGMSRVYSDRIDAGRVTRVAAVLEKHAGLRLSDQDIYVNVAGGLRIGDVGTELALALALFSARSEKALPGSLIAVGELSLAGEIRSVPHLRRRLKAAAETGRNTWLASVEPSADLPPGGCRVNHIRDALAAALPLAGPK